MKIFKHNLLIITTSLIYIFMMGCSSSSVSGNFNSDKYFKNSNVGSLNSNQTKKDTVRNIPIAPTVSKNIIKAGDQLQISVWGYSEFNTTTTVKDHGTVTIPLIGEVMAAGLYVERFKELLTQQLGEYVKGDPEITVSHIDMNKRISVMGAVNKQDNYTFLSDISLVEIIAAAGGPAPEADLSHVKIFRQSESSDVIEVDLAVHLERGDMENIPKVRSGDTVFIPREDNVMRSLSDFARDILLLFGFFTFLY